MIPILMYHSIGTGLEDHPTAPYQVTADAFEAQCDALASAGFRSLDAAALADILDAGELPSEPVVMFTFDDAYTDYAETAVPIMKQHGFHSIVFAATGHLNASTTWPNGDGLPLHSMSRDEIASIAEDHHVTVASHAHSHIRLGEFEDDALLAELTTARSEIEAIPGADSTVLAYPYGWVDKRVRHRTIDAGYTLAMTTRNETCRLIEDRWTLPRLIVDGTQPPLELVEQLIEAADQR